MPRRFLFASGSAAMSQGPFDPRFNQPNPFQPQGYPNQGFPNQSFPSQGFPGQFQPPPKSGGGMKTMLIVGGAMAGGAALLLLLCCGGIYTVMQPPKASAAAKQPFNVAAVPVPAFPDRGQSTEIEPGVLRFVVPINGQTGGHYSPPGHGGTLFVYLPLGDHQPKSLPCVFITGAGTDLMEGYEFEPNAEGDDAEFLPYARAGFAVVAYELDGSGFNEDSDETQMYQDFKAACGGVVNARNAIEFALQRVPEVNPNQFYTAGHSSAGTCALLVAAHEPRVKGVMAYAPCTDVEHFQPGFLIRAMASEMPGLADFLCQSSPKTHESRINCPVFLFHAEADDTVKIKETRKFADLLKKHNTDVTLQTVPGGDHYESMISQGIPAGIDWLKQKAAK
jgi:dienelactone hydrolase